jgi:hypothetical protein
MTESWQPEHRRREVGLAVGQSLPCQDA